MASQARKILKAKYLAEVNWSEIPRVRYFRDEGMLRQGLLTSPDELAAVLAAFPTRRERAMVQCFWTLRRAEVAGLRWADLDLERGTVNMLGKGGKRSWTLLAPGAVAALCAYREECHPVDPWAYLFPGRYGGPMRPHTLGDLVRRRLKRAGLYTRWRGAHSFRRSFATNYLRQNPSDLRGLQALASVEK